MPLLVLAGVLALVVVLSIVLLPLTLVQRYRVSTARRPARGWVASLNLAALALSTAIFLMAAALTTAWVPQAFRSALLGLAGGGALGLLGLALTRWERTPHSLHYTPNRWLVLAITLTVAGRIFYGFWRGWQAWASGLSGGPWLVESGAAGALAAGAVVLGYYVVYWGGIRRKSRVSR